MKTINYILQGFGYHNLQDFYSTVFKFAYLSELKIFISTSLILGTIREFTIVSTGLDIVFWCAFLFLIIAEWQTGLKVDIIKRGNKFQSRKFGRMFLKIFVYIAIITLMHGLAESTKKVVFDGFEINPFGWLYYVVVVAITFQLVISWFENLGNLGYKEAKGLSGVVLRKFNKWFEFEGDKHGDKDFEN